MGIFDEVLLEEGVELPEYPANPTDPAWQSKDIGFPAMDVYKISSEGRLLRRERTTRDKTEVELEGTAQFYGYDSWEELEESDDIGPFPAWKETVDEEWWVDHNYHGSFEFHHVHEGKYYSYEARFTKGDLDEIILLDAHDVS